MKNGAGIVGHAGDFALILPEIDLRWDVGANVAFRHGRHVGEAVGGDEAKNPRGVQLHRTRRRAPTIIVTAFWTKPLDGVSSKFTFTPGFASLNALKTFTKTL